MSSLPELRDLLQAEALRNQAETLPEFGGLRRRATRRRQRRLGGSLAAAVALASAVAIPLLHVTGGGGTTPGSHPSTPAPGASRTDATGASAPDFLPPVALALVRRNGEALPTQIQAVSVDDGAVADTQLRRTAATDTTHSSGYVVEARGTFSCIDCLRVGEAGATGTVLTGIYDPSNNGWDAVSVSHTWVDLNALGASFSLPTRDSTSGQLLSLAAAKREALLDAANPAVATVAWTRELTAGQLAAESSDPVAHIGLAPDKRLIVVAVTGPGNGTGHTMARFAMVFTVDGTGPESSSMNCSGFCGLSAPTGGG
jgi:hypothetical protein